MSPTPTTYAGLMLDRAPYFLRGLPTRPGATSDGDFYLAALGALLDYQLQRRKDAVYNRVPGFAAADALNVLGEERSIVRGAAETDAAYGLRVVQAWTTWLQAGTPQGMLLALEGLGYENVGIGQLGHFYTLDGSDNLVDTPLVPPTYRPGGLPLNFWSAFDVVFFHPLAPSWVPSPPLVTSPEGQQILRVIRTWKPAFATAAHVIILQSGWALGVPPINRLGFALPALGGSTEVVWNLFF